MLQLIPNCMIIRAVTKFLLVEVLAYFMHASQNIIFLIINLVRYQIIVGPATNM